MHDTAYRSRVLLSDRLHFNPSEPDLRVFDFDRDLPAREREELPGSPRIGLPGLEGNPASVERRAWHGNRCVTIGILAVLEYFDRAGSSPFAAWFRRLDATAAAKVTISLRRLEMGNFSNVKGVGAGVFEYRIDFGPDTGSISARMATPW